MVYLRGYDITYVGFLKPLGIGNIGKKYSRKGKYFGKLLILPFEFGIEIRAEVVCCRGRCGWR